MAVSPYHGDNAVDVSILVVSYNSAHRTIAALRSVFEQTRKASFEVIVVDNNSDDRSAEVIRAAFPAVRLVVLKKNVGYAAANNLASTHARGRYILLLHPDTVVRDGAVDEIVEFARNNADARIWGGRTFFQNGELNPSSCWGRLTFWRLLCRVSGLDQVFAGNPVLDSESYGGWDRNDASYVDVVSGCFLMIERVLWSELGGFAPIFFMYGAETDLCLRARSFDARPMIDPEATLTHEGGRQGSVDEDDMIKLLAAKATLIERHFVGMSRHAGLALLLAWPASRAFASWVMAVATSEEDWKTRFAIWRNVWRARHQWWRGYPLQEPTHRSGESETVIRGSELPAA